MTHEQFTFANAKFISDSYLKLETWIEKLVKERLANFDYIENISVYEQDGRQLVTVEYRDRWGDWESAEFTWDELKDHETWLARVEAEKAEAKRKADEARAASERKKYEQALALVQEYEATQPK
jgi:hypothetical protein